MTAISAYHEFKHKVSFDYTNIHPLKTFRASYSPSISPFKRNISQTLSQAPVWILCSQQLGQSHYRGWGGSGDGVGVPSSSSWDSLHFALVLDPSSWSCVFFLGLLPCFGKTSLLVSSSWKHVGNISFETLPFKSILIQSSYIIDGVPMHRILR